MSDDDANPAPVPLPVALNLTEAREKLAAATPGPFLVKSADLIDDEGRAILTVNDWDDPEQQDWDAEWIAYAHNHAGEWLDEIERLRDLVERLRTWHRETERDWTVAAVGRIEALAEKWRYKGEFGWGAWQEGYGPDEEGWILDRAAAEVLAALAADEEAKR